MLNILVRGTYWYESIELLVTKGLLATSKLLFINVPGKSTPRKIGWGVLPAYPIYDQNLRYSLAYIFMACLKFVTLFKTWPVFLFGRSEYKLSLDRVR